MAAHAVELFPPFTRVGHTTDRMDVPAGNRNYMSTFLLCPVAARANIVYRPGKEKGVII
jgi:hypothetical protein